MPGSLSTDGGGASIFSSFVRDDGLAAAAATLSAEMMPDVLWNRLCAPSKPSASTLSFAKEKFVPSDAVVALPLSTMRAIGVIHGQLCNVAAQSSAGGEAEPEKTRRRHVAIVQASEKLVNGVTAPELAFLSPALHGCLFSSSQTLPAPTNGNAQNNAESADEASEKSVRVWRASDDCNATATSLTISNVHRAHWNVVSAALLRLALTDYLFHPRLVAIGDVIGLALPCETLLPFHFDDVHAEGLSDEDNLSDVLPLPITGIPLGEELNYALSVATRARVVFVTVVDAQPRPPDGGSVWINRDDTRIVQVASRGRLLPVDVAKLCERVLHRGGAPTSPKTAASPDVVGRARSAIRTALRATFGEGGGGVDVNASLLLAGAAGSGKATAVVAEAETFGVRVVDLCCAEAAAREDVEEVIAAALESALCAAPSVLFLRDAPSLAPLLAPAMRSASVGGNAGLYFEPLRGKNTVRRLLALLGADEAPSDVWNAGWNSFSTSKEAEEGRTLVIASSSKPVHELDAAFRSLFTYELQLESPDAARREALIRSLTDGWGLEEKLPQRLAMQLAGRSEGEIEALLRDAVGRRLREDEAKKDKNGDDIAVPQVQHLNDALWRMQQAAGSDAAKAVHTSWDDVGGLEHAKDEIIECVELPLRKPQLFRSQLRRRSGLLLYGPPGTGKTLLAKAVASECGCSFISVKGPELMNMYVGESEKNVRDVFQRARAARPCVVFFDELDALAPARGRGSDSSSANDLIVSQLLAEVDGAAADQDDVFVIGATNRPDLVESSLLRPGRFDRLVFVGTPDSRAAQLKVLGALTRKFELSSETDLSRVLEHCPEPPLLSGADLYGLASAAWLAATKRLLLSSAGETSDKTPQAAERSNDGEQARPPRIVVTEADFVEASETLTPSLTMRDITSYAELRQRFEGGK